MYHDIPEPFFGLLYKKNPSENIFRENFCSENICSENICPENISSEKFEIPPRGEEECMNKAESAPESEPGANSKNSSQKNNSQNNNCKNNSDLFLLIILLLIFSGEAS